MTRYADDTYASRKLPAATVWYCRCGQRFDKRNATQAAAWAYRDCPRCGEEV